MKKTLLVVALLSFGAASVALAAGDERRATEAILAELEGHPAHKGLTQDLVKRSRAVAERAARMRAAGDETHARLADAVAREWAEAARELARAADVEARAAAARSGALDAGSQAERERALLEEGIAHNGRLRAEIEQVDREKAEQPARTAPIGADGGAPAPTRPAPGPGRKTAGPTDAGVR
jgi:hypothetical protein